MQRPHVRVEFNKAVLKHSLIIFVLFKIYRFYDLSDVFPKGDYEAAREGATGKRLFELLIVSFNKHGIPLDNFIGFACDNAPVMVGEHNSVWSRLRELCPGKRFSVHARMLYFVHRTSPRGREGT